MKKIALAGALAWTLVSGGPAAAAGDWTWPVHGPVITPYRNGDDPYAAGQHRGVDVAAPVGTAVVAATSGTITFAGVVGSSGLTVAERTSDGRYELSYLHLSSAAVHQGDRIDAGSRLGSVGVSGQRSAERPHLHFGVRDAGARQSYRDPLEFLAPVPPGGDPQQRPAPVPDAAPARPQEAPAPVYAPAVSSPSPVAAGPAVRLPEPLRLRVRVPNAHAAPGHGGPHTAPATGPRGAVRLPAPPAGMPGLVRRPGHREVRHGRPAPAAPAALGRGPGEEAVDGAPAPTRAVGHDRAAHRPAGRRIDLAWLAACIGLVAAAVVLGRPRRGSKRAGALSLLRPLLRRS